MKIIIIYEMFLYFLFGSGIISLITGVMLAKEIISKNTHIK